MVHFRAARGGLVGALLLSSFASGQGFVERALDAGLVLTSRPGLDSNPNADFLTSFLQFGAAIGDVDGDLDADVIASGRIDGTKLFRNDGTGQFSVDPNARIATSDFDNCVALGDADRDGDLDLFVGVHLPGTEGNPGREAGRNRLHFNDGAGFFSNRSPRLGHRGNGHTLAATWFDFDYDGDLDLFTVEFHGSASQLLINDGTGSFCDRAEELGAEVRGATHVFSVADVDDNGYADLLIGNDWIFGIMAEVQVNRDDVHLANTGEGFIDVTPGSSFDHQLPLPVPPIPPGSTTMGMTIGDVNYDGRLDIFKTEKWTQFLLLNNGWPSGTPWTQAQLAYGVDNPTVPHPDQSGDGPTVGWGCKFVHADLDPWLDLYKVNGRVSGGDPITQPDAMFRGQGPNDGFAFDDVTATWGLLDAVDDRGLSVGDLDADGDLDFVRVPIVGDLLYMENQLARNGMGWLVVEAVGRTSSPNGTGALVRWTDSDGYPHVQQIGGDGGTASMHERIAHFGLGLETSVDVAVEFPSGVVRRVSGVAPNTRIQVVEPELVRVSQTRFNVATPVLDGSDAVQLPGRLGIVEDVDPTQFDGGSSLANPGAAGTSRPAPIEPDALVVTAFAHDANGAELGADANVTIEVPGLTPTGSVRHVGGNVFERAFQRSSTPGAFRAQVAFDGFAPRIRPTIQFVGVADIDETNVVVEPQAVLAGTGDRVDVLVVPRDAAGLALGAGRDVRTPTGDPLLDLGDGTYLFETSAPQTPGNVLIGVVVDGLLLPGLAELEVGGVPVPERTVVLQENPTPEWCATLNQTKFRVTPRDAGARRSGAQAAFEVVLTPQAGSEPAYFLEDPGFVRQVDGSVTFVIERDPSAALDSARGVWELRVAGVTIATDFYEF